MYCVQCGVKLADTEAVCPLAVIETGTLFVWCSVPAGLDSVLPCGVGSTLSFCILTGVAPLRINNKRSCLK